jgi:hypothetical protein
MAFSMGAAIERELRHESGRMKGVKKEKSNVSTTEASLAHIE